MNPHAMLKEELNNYIYSLLYDISFDVCLTTYVFLTDLLQN